MHKNVKKGKSRWPAVFDLGAGCSHWSSLSRRGDFLLSHSAVLFEFPAENTDLGEEFFILLPCPTPSHISSPFCLTVLLVCPSCFLSVHFPLGEKLESLVHKKRSEESGTDGLHRNDFLVKKAEGPWWRKNLDGFWQIATFNIDEETMVTFEWRQLQPWYKPHLSKLNSPKSNNHLGQEQSSQDKS